MNIRCFVLMLALSLPAHADNLIRITASLPDLASPPQGEAHWIAHSMRMNGLPMTLKAFDSRLSPDAVLSHYELEAKLAGTHEARRIVNAPWQILMLKSRNHFITVHAREVNSGSEGTILVSPALDPRKLAFQTEFPKPASARIVNLQQYDDDGMESEHISLTSTREPFAELQAFSQLLIGDGWAVTDTRPASEMNRGFVLEVQKQAQHALLVIGPNAARPSTTAIVVAWKK
jgi:hypothetical protein